MKEDRQFVTALARGLEVLRCFSPNRQVLSATEIAGRIGLPQPTVWRLCHTLVATGYLVAAPGGKLRIGAPVLALGYAALASLDYLQIIRPHMQQLADRFGGTVGLAERHRSKMIHLEHCTSTSLLVMNLPVGSRLSLHDTATGWSYLSALPPERRQVVLERLRTALAPEWPKHQANIDRACETCQRQGYVFNTATPYSGSVTLVAMPILGPDGKPVFVLSVSVPTAMATGTSFAEDAPPALLEVGRMLEAQLVMSGKGKKKGQGGRR